MANRSRKDSAQPKFEPWRDLATAPRDGTEIEARGYNWGDKTRGRHRYITYWDGQGWRDAYDEDLTLRYLEEWRPYNGEKHAVTAL
jgi:hypothetical protein